MMTVYAAKPLSYKERLEYAGKAYTERYTGEKSIGYLKKFNDALGYKKLEYDDKTFSKEIDSPEGYESPYKLLLLNRYFLNRKDEIMTFMVTNKRMEHPISEYSYSTIDMMFRFQKYLYKLFPGAIRIEFELGERIALSDRDYVLSYFWDCISQCECVDTETAIKKKLTKKEEDYILNIMRKIVTYEPAIQCDLCDTCFDHHPDFPYHVELVHAGMEKKEMEAGIQYGYYRPSFLKEQERFYKSLQHKVMIYKHTGKLVADSSGDDGAETQLFK